jgi:DNA-directed RNA polymerase specialized sigma24 family protein
MAEINLMKLAFKNHNEWLKMATSLGGGDFNEDIVQEMYIRLHRYQDDPTKALYKNEINKGLVYVIIRSITFNLANAKNKSKELILLHENIEQITIPSEEYNHEDDSLMELINEEVSTWHWFDRDLFNYIYIDGMSMRSISRSSGISLSCIFNTMKNARERIKNATETQRQEA